MPNQNRDRPEVNDDIVPGYPDDRDQNPTQLSLEQFCHKANRLYAALQNSSDAKEAEHATRFNQFVLAGRTRNRHGVPGHVTLNACQGLLEIEELTVTRDYDSLIGISKDLPFTHHLELLPVPPFKLTLKTPNHVNSTAIVNVRNQCIDILEVADISTRV